MQWTVVLHDLNHPFIHSLIGPAVILSIVIKSPGDNLASSADYTLNELERSKTSRALELGHSETVDRALELYFAKITIIPLGKNELNWRSSEEG